MESIVRHTPQGFIPPHELAGLPPATPVLVAFSGGADSALLLALTVACAKAWEAPVYAAHFHHGIRGDEADRDLAFCQETANKLGVPLLTGYADVPALAAASGRSIEHEARLARYAFLEDLMRQRDIPLLATAHHADDQLETLLLRFLRGSGTKGMGGIHPVRPLGQGYIVRPLLACTKEQILSCCAAMDIPFVTDSTNASDLAARNRLRHHLIPLMAELTDHGTPAEAALRLSAGAREDEELLSALARDAYNACIAPSADGSLLISALAGLHPALGKRTLAIAFSQAQACHRPDPDGRYSLSSLHLESLWRFVSSSEAGEMHLPGKMRAVIQNGELRFSPLIPPKDLPENLPVPLLPGVTSWDEERMGIRVQVCDVSHPCEPVPGEIIAHAVFPTSVLPLTARRREAGDVLVSHGMSKKLKKLLCDHDVPPDMRPRLPLLCYGSQTTPLWYPTVAFADGFPPPTHGSCVKITIFYQNLPKGILS